MSDKNKILFFKLIKHSFFYGISFEINKNNKNYSISSNYGKKFIGFHIRILKLKDTSKDELELLSLRVMGRYKVLILIFNLVPLLALHLMSS